jgi:hypothetical protein
MSKKARITIVLDYDLETLSYMLGRNIPEEEFEDEVWEYSFHDLQELLRTEDVSVWATMEMIGDN